VCAECLHEVLTAVSTESHLKIVDCFALLNRVVVLLDEGQLVFAVVHVGSYVPVYSEAIKVQ
jgi:hypothetical protein